MIKQVLAGAAFATAATMAVAAPASATTGPQPHKTPANALQSVLATPLAQGSTTSGTGCGCVGGTVSGITGSGTTGNLAGTTGGLTGNGTTGNLTGTVTGTTSNLTGNGTT
ncbi:hypothetical protein, partial [Streptomyces sp. NPDC050485]|uniref:hypothetical protein n=1 Tax=Streptomyces sp. NPDC050485 TaxID=3365617 RepID=UPI0037B26933